MMTPQELNALNEELKTQETKLSGLGACLSVSLTGLEEIVKKHGQKSDFYFGSVVGINTLYKEIESIIKTVNATRELVKKDLLPTDVNAALNQLANEVLGGEIAYVSNAVSLH